MTAPRRERIRKVAGIVVLIVALVFLLFGVSHKVRAYDSDSDEFGMLTFQKISEAQLTEDATFGGAERKEGRLYSTYDRSKPKEGKRACPT